MPKAVKIILIVILALIAVAVIFIINICAVRFDYISKDSDIAMENGDYGLLRPFFGNSMSITKGSGPVKTYPFGIGEWNEPIYSAVNGVLADYELSLENKYENRIKNTYSVVNDGKKLAVFFSGEVYPNGASGKAVAFEKAFLFNIENASLEKLPYLMEEIG